MRTVRLIRDATKRISKKKTSVGGASISGNLKPQVLERNISGHYRLGISKTLKYRNYNIHETSYTTDRT